MPLPRKSSKQFHLFFFTWPVIVHPHNQGLNPVYHRRPSYHGLQASRLVVVLLGLKTALHRNPSSSRLE
jgi:hypothetical protein